jgi:anaerobic selenocysteine-containing dehydrogenase
MQTACGLDCYDACRILVKNDDPLKIEGDREHPAGNGALCIKLNKFIFETPRIEKPRINGVEASMEEALQAVAEAFRAKRSLLWRGSGNVGVMQEVTNLFMEKIGGSLTKGSLCDGAGDAGILAGRGVNKMLPLEQIQKADTVVVWGRNLTVTNAHLMPFLEDKKIVVIDPVKTPIAKKADFHLQIKPRTDYYVAILLARFIFMENSEDKTWMDKFASSYEDFYDYTREHRIKAILEYIGIDLEDMGRMLEYLRNQKVVFLVGVGVQKYTIGSYVLHAIDSLAATLGLFGKEGCGVSYLGNSKWGFENPFDVNCSRESKVVTAFSDFETVFVQGGNPAESMPDSLCVERELQSVENLIYFGLYENETSKRAKIVLPAKNFFEKEDIRLSYGHHYVEPMQKIKDADFGISEYDLTKKLFDAFGFDGLQSEEYYLRFWLDQCRRDQWDNFLSPGYEMLPYADGFGESRREEFVFIDDYNDDFINTKHFKKHRKGNQEKQKDQLFWLISSKAVKTLNTQFLRENKVQLHPALGYKEGETVHISSEYGSYEFTVKLNEDVRRDCVLITNNTRGINRLTPSIVSEEGESACYQEVKVQIKRI